MYNIKFVYEQDSWTQKTGEPGLLWPVAPNRWKNILCVAV